MSKFIDKLTQISQGGPQPMGFGVGKPVSSQPKMLLVASLTEVASDNLADYVAGADAGLLPLSLSPSGVEKLGKASRAVPDIPWGGWLRGGGVKEIKQMEKVDCDFVVFPAAGTSLAISGSGEVGKILEVEASLDVGLLPTIDDLPVDAVLIAGEGKGNYSLNWHHLMLFRRLADAVSKPLLVSVSSGVTADELQLLWDVGVGGVIVRAGVGGLKKLRRAIDKLAFSAQGKRRKERVLLPHVSVEIDEDFEEE